MHEDSNITVLSYLPRIFQLSYSINQRRYSNLLIEDQPITTYDDTAHNFRNAVLHDVKGVQG